MDILLMQRRIRILGILNGVSSFIHLILWLVIILYSYKYFNSQSSIIITKFPSTTTEFSDTLSYEYSSTPDFSSSTHENGITSTDAKETLIRDKKGRKDKFFKEDRNSISSSVKQSIKKRSIIELDSNEEYIYNNYNNNDVDPEMIPSKIEIEKDKQMALYSIGILAAILSTIKILLSPIMYQAGDKKLYAKSKYSTLIMSLLMIIYSGLAVFFLISFHEIIFTNRDPKLKCVSISALVLLMIDIILSLITSNFLYKFITILNHTLPRISLNRGVYTVNPKVNIKNEIL